MCCCAIAARIAVNWLSLSSGSIVRCKSRSGCHKSQINTTRSESPSCQTCPHRGSKTGLAAEVAGHRVQAPERVRTSCSNESSNIKHSPSFHSRTSLPTRIRTLGGQIRPKWQRSRKLDGPQCALRCVPAQATKKTGVRRRRRRRRQGRMRRTHPARAVRRSASQRSPN